MLRSKSVVMSLQGLALFAAGASLAACDLPKVAVGTTSKVLYRGKPSMNQEADYEIAARAIPGSLKTVEAFHMVDPENTRLTMILAEGYCQYASGFIEDEWELAILADDFENVEYQSERASKSFIRCMGYGLHALGSSWKKAVQGTVDEVKRKISDTDYEERDAMLWTGVGLAGAINHNKSDPGMVAQLTKARLMVDGVIKMDDSNDQGDKYKRATAHVVRAMIHMALPEALGGTPEEGRKEFELALKITENKFLLAKVLLARRYAVATQNKTLFRKLLVEVLQTNPAIWPQQRLANEIAHRRAKRYLKHEKEYF